METDACASFDLPNQGAEVPVLILESLRLIAKADPYHLIPVFAVLKTTAPGVSSFRMIPHSAVKRKNEIGSHPGGRC